MSTPHEDARAQPFSARLGLLERDAELAAVEGLISAASRGGRLLAIEGPAGIGKSSLMAETRARGQQAGMRVLGARGSELERAFSYGVVRQLFEPFLARLRAEERAELFAGAATLATPLFDPAQLAAEPAADVSLATLHGLYWLTANVATHQPLLLAVDDLHWCDLSSLRWLTYLLPRMEGLGLLVVVGLRPAEPGEDPALLSQIVSDPLATVVRPAPLSAEAATRLVRESLAPDADDAFCAAFHEQTGGNPLLLRESGACRRPGPRPSGACARPPGKRRNETARATTELAQIIIAAECGAQDAESARARCETPWGETPRPYAEDIADATLLLAETAIGERRMLYSLIDGEYEQLCATEETPP